MKQVILPLLALIILGIGAVSASAQGGWVKLGEKDVNFDLDHDTITASNKGSIREIRLSVKNAPVKFTRVVINYKDGEKQELEFLEEVAIGKESRSLTLRGDGHPIKTIDLWYETNSLRGKKAKVRVYGRR